MISPEQKAHFDTFGFLILRQAFTPDEINKITSEADIVLEENSLSKNEGITLDQFVERHPPLLPLLDDDRIQDTITGLLGPGFVWAGSEGQITHHREHGWHPDRPGDEEEVSYLRIKVMLYLDALDKDNGCLRVIPGSHRLPLHTQIEPENRHQHGDFVKPFDVIGQDIPGFPFECRPGDVMFFCQSLWHGMFNGKDGRRYVALKFAARPTTDKHLASLRYYKKDIFEPRNELLKSDRPRIRQMVEDLPRLGAKKVPAFIPFRDD
jgi:hypothetical protein